MYLLQALNVIFIRRGPKQQLQKVKSSWLNLDHLILMQQDLLEVNLLQKGLPYGAISHEIYLQWLLLPNLWHHADQSNYRESKNGFHLDSL